MDRILFTNANVIDGTGAAGFAGHVLVEGNRIAAVGHGAAAGVDDARTIDVAGATVMPGLIDAHMHLALGSSIHVKNRPADRSDAQTALLMTHCARVLLDAGFTSGYSGGSASVAAEIAVRDAIEAGWIAGPRMRTASVERVPGGPMGLRVDFSGAASRQPAPADIVQFVRDMKAAGVDSVKFLLNGVSAFHPGSNKGEQFYDEEIEAAAAVAHAEGLWLTAHCYSSHAVQLAARTGFRVLYHCNYADEAAFDAIEARKHDVFVGPAPGIVEADLLRGPNFGIMASPPQRAEQQELVEAMKATGRELRRRGVRQLPGGDYGFPWNPIGLNARDLTLFVDWFGYTPLETIHAATALGGVLMDRGQELGKLAPGYLADLLVVAGDPSQDISILEQAANLRVIMKDGRFHKGAPV